MKSHASAVVLCPPKDCWPAIQAVRERYDRNHRRWMPHVTLLYPFAPSEAYGNDLIDRLAVACRSMEPFEAKLCRFRHFSHRGKWNTVWLDPEPADRMVAVQARLQKAFTDYNDVQRFARGFTPHLTVGQVKDDVRDETLQSLQDAWSPITFRADRIALIWRNDPPDDVFRVYREIVFGTTDVVVPGEE